jgi:CheY-like chemotaxis protein
MRILVVEDEALVAMLLEDMVADAGHELAFTAGTVPEALAYVNEHGGDFDYAVLDVNLGGQASYPIAEALAAAGKPFAFSTGYGAGGLPEVWRSRPILSKPFGSADVERVLNG